MNQANPKQDFKNMQKIPRTVIFHDSRFICFCMKPEDFYYGTIPTPSPARLPGMD